MKILRTPDACFENLPDYPFSPHYVSVPDGEGSQLRIHYVDEGPDDGPVILLMHGEPSWSYLYRKMIPPLVEAGYRTIAPDLPGFGRSDKPAAMEDYTYQRHVDWMTAFLDTLPHQDLTLFCQDWGGLIGLRLVAANPDRFARVITGNTGLPTGDQSLGEALEQWRRASQEMPVFNVGKVVSRGCVRPVPAEVIAAYDAPFPDESYKAGARIFPTLIPADTDDPSCEPNRAAWQVLFTFDKPWLNTFSDGDPLTRGADHIFEKMVPGTRDMPHTTIKNAGHFLQEDAGEEIAAVIIDFMANTTAGDSPEP